MDYNLVFIMVILLVVVLSAVGVFKMFYSMLTIIALVFVMILGANLYNNGTEVANTVPEPTEKDDTSDTEDFDNPRSYTDSQPTKEYREKGTFSNGPNPEIVREGEVIHRHYHYFPEGESPHRQRSADPLIYAKGSIGSHPDFTPVDQEYEEITPATINCHRYNRSERRYVILEEIYTQQSDAEEQTAFLQSQGFKKAQVICLSCFAGYDEENHFAVILGPPCETEQLANEKRNAYSRKWESKKMPFCKMKMLYLGDLKPMTYAKPSDRGLAHQVDQMTEQEIY